MVTLTFVFNQEKVASAGSTEDELLYPMREHAKKYGISEDEYGVFSKDGEDALCVLTMVIPKITQNNREYLDFLKEWTLDVDGETEDCIKESREWFEEHQKQEMLR